MTIHVVRIRKGVPGIGRKLGNLLRERGHEVQEVTCKHRPLQRIKEGDVVFNYGRSEDPVWYNDLHNVTFLNKPVNVAMCVNKIKTLIRLSGAGVPCVEWTGSVATVDGWLNHGSRVFVRTTVTGKKGKGIVILHNRDADVVHAPLYTKEFPSNPDNKREFRVHVFKGQVIDYTQKKRMRDEKVENRGYVRNDDVRNKANGWAFCHNKIIDSKLVRDVAVKAAEALGMDYCGVDIIGEWDQEKRRIVDAKVCEVNSAPGMSNTKTIDSYIKAIEKVVNDV